jgi:C1A family cysteine protease
LSSIIFEISNEEKLTVQEYVRFAQIKEQIETFLENTKIKQALGEHEKNIKGLTIDLTIKYTIEKKSGTTELSSVY